MPKDDPQAKIADAGRRLEVLTCRAPVSLHIRREHRDINEIGYVLLAQSDKGPPRSCLLSDQGLRSPWNAQAGKVPGVVVFVNLCPFDGTAIRIKDAAHIATLGQQLASCLDRRVA